MHMCVSVGSALLRSDELFGKRKERISDVFKLDRAENSTQQPHQTVRPFCNCVHTPLGPL